MQLKKLKGIQLPLESTNYADNLFWVFGIIVDQEIGTADYFMKKLAELGIGTRPFFYPMHKQPIFLKMGICNKNQDLEISEYLGNQGFYIPSGLGISNDDIKYVCDAMYEIFDQ